MLFFIGKHVHKAKKAEVKLYYLTASAFYEVCAGPLITTVVLQVGRSDVAKGLLSS